MGNLKKAGLIEIKSGTGGAQLLKCPDKISLFEVYQAGEVIQDGELFNIHDKSNSDCPVGAKIQGILEIFLLKAQKAMEEVLKSVTIKDVLNML